MNERICTPLWDYGTGPPRSGGVGSWGIDIMNERIRTSPLEGLRKRDVHTQTKTHSTHTLAQVQIRIPKLSPPAITKHRFASPSPSYNRWQYAWSTNCSTTPSASRGGPHRKRTHAGPCAALAHTPNRSWHSAAPSNPSSHDRGAAGMAMHLQRAAAGNSRSWSRQPLERRADLALRPSPLPRPSPPVPQIDHSARRAHGAPSRAPTQRSTPDAGANARSQRAL